MKYTIFIFCVSFFAHSSAQKRRAVDDSSSDMCGTVNLESLATNIIDFRVVGGTDILIQQSPWTAILELAKTENPDKIEVFCGGTLISPNLITSAAHCFWGNFQAGRECPEQFRSLRTQDECHNQNGGCPTGCRRLRPQDINVHLGTTSITKQDRTPIAVEAIHIHELWVKSRLSDRKKVLEGHDIALLKLAKKQSFNDKIQPICLPNDLFVELRNATIDGFGSVVPGVPGLTIKNAERLQRGLVQTMTKEACNTSYKFLLQNDQLCANSEGIDSCRGDSGTGLTTILDGQPEVNMLIGITSFGSIYCGTDSRPGVYTNVMSHMEWIKPRISLSLKTWGPWTLCSTTCGPGIKEKNTIGCQDDDFDIFREDCMSETKECFNRPCGDANILQGNSNNNIGRVLLVGGYVGAAKQSNQVFLQDCHYSSFEDVKVPKFPVNISLSAGQILEDTVFICGGFDGNFQSQRHCFTFTFQLGEKWKEGPSLMTPRANAAMISTEAGLWITGGRNGPINFLDSTEFFNKSTAAWVNGPMLNRKLGLHCALTYETPRSDRMIIIGGTWFDDRSEDFIRTDIVENYDLSTGESTAMPSLKTARSGHSCVLLPKYNGKEYVILVTGGKMSSKQRLSSVEFFQSGASRETVAFHTAIVLPDQLCQQTDYDYEEYEDIFDSEDVFDSEDAFDSDNSDVNKFFEWIDLRHSA